MPALGVIAAGQSGRTKSQTNLHVHQQNAKSRSRRGSDPLVDAEVLLLQQQSHKSRQEKRKQVMEAGFKHLQDVSNEVWDQFLPLSVYASPYAEVESPSPTFGVPEIRAATLESAIAEDDQEQQRSTGRTPENFHPSVIDDSSGDWFNHTTTLVDGSVAPNWRATTGGSGRATPADGNETSDMARPLPVRLAMGIELNAPPASPGVDTAEPSADSEEEEVSEEVVAEPICGGRFRDKQHLKEWLRDLLEEPTTSSAAKVISIVVLICIIISTMNIILESLPAFDQNMHGRGTKFWVLFILEATCIAVFSVEYLLRLWAVPDRESRLEWMRQPMNVIDLIAIIPFFIDLAMLIAEAGEGGLLKLLRLFRLIRIFRIFKLSRYSQNVQMCSAAMIESRETLGLMIFMLLIAVTLFSAFEYFFEMGTKNDSTGKYMINAYGVEQESLFTSIPATMWWCVVTLMTVGYGDMYPYTPLGKVVGIIAMICAILILALPISVIGANFSQAWLSSKEAKERMSEGRELSRELQSVLGSMAEYCDLLEDLLSDACRNIEELQVLMTQARQLFDAQYGPPGEKVATSGDQVVMEMKPIIPEGKLLEKVHEIIEKQDELHEILFKTDHLYSVEVEQKVSIALDNFTRMESLVDDCSRLRTTIKEVEMKALDVHVGVTPNRDIDQNSVALY